MEAVVNSLQRSEAQPLGSHCPVLERQMVPERFLCWFDSGMVVIATAFLALSEALLRHLFHVVVYTHNAGSDEAGSDVSRCFAERIAV